MTDCLLCEELIYEKEGETFTADLIDETGRETTVKVGLHDDCLLKRAAEIKKQSNIYGMCDSCKTPVFEGQGFSQTTDLKTGKTHSYHADKECLPKPWRSAFQ